MTLEGQKISPALLGRDLLASLVVFVVALPLCLGIAIASGVPPAMGLISGILGGLVVGTIAGSPLQVTGPAAGLAVIIYELVQEHGIPTLGIIIVAAGLIQFVAGLLKIGQVFRAITPAVVFGMLAGIGVLIFCSQVHVMVDDKPRSSGVRNLLSIPEAVYKGVTMPEHRTAALIGLLTIAVLVGWNKFRPKSLQLIPGPLVAVVTATVLDYALGLPITNINVPSNLLSLMAVPPPEVLSKFGHIHVWLEAIALAFVASAETLLSASAVDRMHTGPRTNFNKELAAQGVGNMVCGLFGGLPMTGVIVRSSANVLAGAKTRLSAIMHGAWLAITVLAFPDLLRHIPTACLAAILVHTGFKLVNIDNIKRLRLYGVVPVAIYFSTLIGIVVTDLLTGVMIGLGLSAAKLLYAFTRLEVRVEIDSEKKRVTMTPIGAATFVRMTTLANALDKVPNGHEVHIEIDRLTYIDHACLELLMNWETQEAQNGKSVLVEWDDLADRAWHQGAKLARLAPVAKH